MNVPLARFSEPKIPGKIIPMSSHRPTTYVTTLDDDQEMTLANWASHQADDFDDYLVNGGLCDMIDDLAPSTTGEIIDDRDQESINQQMAHALVIDLIARFNLRHIDSRLVLDSTGE